MATVTQPGPFVTKPAEQLIEAAETTRLHRAVGALDLTALGQRDPGGAPTAPTPARTF
jgi:hypothetical protein